jgi:8-oxo-dGTP diphosphatase
MSVKQVFRHYERSVQPSGLFKYCPYCTTALELAQEETGLRSKCPDCGFIQHRNPAPTVSILILEGERVVLGKRGGEPGKGTWSLPSGYVEWEDDFLTTAVREAREETGLDVEVVSIASVLSSFVSPRFHFLGIYVTARVAGGALAAGDDLVAVAWFPLTKLPEDMGFQEDICMIELVAGKDYVGLGIDAEYASASGSARSAGTGSQLA